MHKSRLAGFVIDCQATNLSDASVFWGGALGMKIRALPGSEGERYSELIDPAGRLHVEVQLVNHPSRVHLDIETDDVHAEVRRLENLGAKKVRDVQAWVVMEAPTGQRFCIVQAENDQAFMESANAWP